VGRFGPGRYRVNRLNQQVRLPLPRLSPTLDERQGRPGGDSSTNGVISRFARAAERKPSLSLPARRRKADRAHTWDSSRRLRRSTDPEAPAPVA
jgi:hypothetical protein